MSDANHLSADSSPPPYIKPNILFLCTGNSCRSQMAEGFARHLKSHLITPYSAGIETHGLNPYAVAVMAEYNIDITTQKSQTVQDLGPVNFDYVITVCGHAHENCPLFTGDAKIIHTGFEDPPKLAAELTDSEEILNCYRKVRDQIRDYVLTIPQVLTA